MVSVFGIINNNGKVAKIFGLLFFFNVRLLYKATAQLQKRKWKSPPRRILKNYLNFLLFSFSIKIIDLIESLERNWSFENLCTTFLEVKQDTTEYQKTKKNVAKMQNKRKPRNLDTFFLWYKSCVLFLKWAFGRKARISSQVGEGMNHFFIHICFQDYHFVKLPILFSKFCVICYTIFCKLRD